MKYKLLTLWSKDKGPSQNVKGPQPRGQGPQIKGYGGLLVFG